MQGDWRQPFLSKRVIMPKHTVFSVFRRTAEAPLYRIEKMPRLARRQGAYSVVNTTGLIMKRGHELRRVLRMFEKTRIHLVQGSLL